MRRIPIILMAVMTTLVITACQNTSKGMTTINPHSNTTTKNIHVNTQQKLVKTPPKKPNHTTNKINLYLSNSLQAEDKTDKRIVLLGTLAEESLEKVNNKKQQARQQQKSQQVILTDTIDRDKLHGLTLRTEQPSIQISEISTNNYKKTLTVKATAYNALCPPVTTDGKSYQGCSGITATGIDVRNNTPPIIAVDPTVIPLHSIVELYHDGMSLGIYQAEDTGGDIKGNRIDILKPTYADAMAFGVRENLEVRILDLPEEVLLTEYQKLMTTNQ